jgi:hypothetical protein
LGGGAACSLYSKIVLYFERASVDFYFHDFCYNGVMESLSVLDQLLNPSAGWLTPIGAQKLIHWKVSDELRNRIEELGQRANRGQLTAEEDAEYRAYLDDAELISLLQIKARRLYPSNR